MNSLYGVHYIKGHAVDVYGYDSDKERITYCVDNGKERQAKRHYVLHGLGGNPYPGTLIEYYDIILPNGKKTRLENRA